MKIINNFRNLLLALLATFCINVNAQTGGNIKATPTLKGTNIAEAINNKYGILGSQITSTINYTAPTLSEGQSISGTTVYRVYNNNEEKIQSDRDSGFTPYVGVNQTLNYKIIFTIKDEDGKESSYEKVTDEPFIFSIFDSEGYVVDIPTKPAGAAKNTYAGRKQSVNYGAIVTDNGKTLPPYSIDWTINENPTIVSSGTSYEFDPSKLQNTDKVEYTFHATVKFLNPQDSTKEWFEGSSGTTETLVVFPKQPNVNLNDVLHYPTNVKGYTTHNGIECNYSVNITSDEYNKFGGILYEWTSDIKNTQKKDNLYSFIASEDKKGNHTIHVRVVCVNPDNPSEEWYNFIDANFNPLTICLNPESIREKIINDYVNYPIEKGYTRFNTYVGKETQTYKVEIPNETEYGDWSYVWTRTFNTTPEEIKKADASFNPSTAGRYSWELSIACNNPNAEENWLTIDNSVFSIPELVVYEDPNSLEINDSYFIYPKGQDLADHKGNENDCSRQYRVQLPKNADDYGQWTYNWTRNGSLVSSGLDADITNSISVGSYNTSLELSCINPDTKEVWRTYTKTFPEYVVYPQPICNRKNLHYNPTDTDDTNYAMYVNQSLETKELLDIDGGYKEGWGVYLYVNGVESDNTTFTPQNISNNAGYKLELKVINEVPLSDGSGTKILYGKNNDNIFDYTFVVYENPYSGINVEVDDNPYSVDNDKVIDIEDNQKVKFYHNTSKFDWELKNEKGTTEGEAKEVSIYEQNLKNYSESDDEATLYYLSCMIKESELPDHFVGTLTSEKFSIYVWKKFDLKIEDLVLAPENDPYAGYYVIETCSDRIGISFKGVGGTINKWDENAVWRSLDIPSHELPSPTDLNQKKDYNYRFRTQNNSNNPIEYRYEVSVKFKDKPEPFKRKILIKSWKQPELKSTIARLKNNKSNPDGSSIEYFISDPSNAKNPCYSGDTILIQCDLSGGDPNNSTAWEYYYKDQDGVEHNEAIVDNSIPYCFKYSGSSEYSNISSGQIEVSYKYKGNYTTDNNVWYSYNQIRLYNRVYSRPESESSQTDSVINKVVWGRDVVDVYAGDQNANKVNLKFLGKKGRNDGWAYYWTVDGNTELGSNPEWSYNPTTNSNEPYEEKQISVHVVNSLTNGNKGLDTTYVYPIRVWRKAKFEDFILKDVIQNRELRSDSYAIREGNGIYASVPAIQYGYNRYGNNYSYQWTGAHTDNDTIQWSDIARNEKNDLTKAYDNLTYNLRMVNTGPYGNVWDVKTFSHNVTVYNKPATPTSIVQKGNGTSRTMIATANVSDQDLEGREYYLVFGYTDETGVDHDFASQKQLNPGQVRWSKPFGNLQQMSDAYVYAVWKYGDAEITSGKCMLSGIDEDYDSSTYNSSTRAAIGEDNPNAIDVASDISDVRGVYSLNGVKVGSTLSDLKPGLYIVEFTNGVTNKIIVK